MYDVFISYAHRDQERVRGFAGALKAEGLTVFIDETEVETFSSIQSRFEEGIAKSKALLAWYSVHYSKSCACQWEMSAAYLCGSASACSW